MNNDDFPPTKVLPVCTSLQIWAGVAPRLHESTRHGTLPASYFSPMGEAATPAPKGVSWDTAAHSQPCHGVFHPGRGTPKPVYGKSRALLSQAAGGKPRRGKAGLKSERAWS